ncbi:hypothetical protein GQ457_17G012790 [Hibiscus cannabinus]
MNNFRDVSTDCSLLDIGYSGNWFTWEKEDSCENEVRLLWESTTGHVLDRLEILKHGLITWFHKLRLECKFSESQLKQRLEDLAELSPTDDAKFIGNNELEQTGFAMRRNKVTHLVDSTGVSISTDTDIGVVARLYFEDLFTSQGSHNSAAILGGISQCITPEINSLLDREFTAKEIWLAVKSMAPLKASGEDGFGAIFYQRFWHIVGEAVSHYCTDLLNGVEQISNFNHTHIVLIPKVRDPSSISHFRPISLCNVIYKIVAKVLANRLQNILHLCIDEAQSAFIPGRLITDNIIAGYEMQRVTTPPVVGLNLVVDLIDPTSNQWNQDLIVQHFSPAEVRSIIAIPLPSTPEPDFHVWTGELSGLYTVRSGYKLLLPSSPVSDVSRNICKKIWQTSCPSKLKICAWKVTHNFLPTKENLCFRRIATDPFCLRCFNAIESRNHLFRDCFFAMNLWTRLGVSWPTSVGAFDFAEWLSWLFDSNTMIRCSDIIIALWALWYSRNLLYHEGKAQTVAEIFIFIRSYRNEIKCIQERLPCSLPGDRIPWKAPPLNVAKVNFDASFSSSEQRSCSGVVIRNDQGMLLGSCFTSHDHIASPFAAEAVTAIAGLRFALHLGLQSIILEGDARSIILRLLDRSRDVSVLSPLISEGKSLARNFRDCAFMCVPRFSNRATHVMARKGFTVMLDSFWVDEAPPEVNVVVEDDRRLLTPHRGI